MAQGFRLQKIAPEFYFHYELRRRLSPDSLAEVKAALGAIAKTAFAEQFRTAELEFEIELEAGSIRGWIRTKKTTVAAILLTANALTKYGDVRSGGQLLYDDVRAALTFTKTHVEQLFESRNGITDQVHAERRAGAIAQLDQFIGQYQRGEISYEEYLQAATAVLAKIQQSPDREQIIPALRQYMDRRNVNWLRLAGQVPVPPEPRDEEDQPRDIAILDPNEPRRRRGGSGGTRR